MEGKTEQRPKHLQTDHPHRHPHECVDVICHALERFPLRARSSDVLELRRGVITLVKKMQLTTIS